MNNEKREEIYLITSQKDILEKELKFWVYDFERIKLNTEIRNRIKEINMPKLVNNIHDELSHKRYNNILIQHNDGGEKHAN
jgi:hypothetical protein